VPRTVTQFCTSEDDGELDLEFHTQARLAVPAVVRVNPWRSRGAWLTLDEGAFEDEDPRATPDRATPHELYLRREVLSEGEVLPGFGSVDPAESPQSLDSFMRCWGPLWVPDGLRARRAVQARHPGIPLDLPRSIDDDIELWKAREQGTGIHREEARRLAQVLRAAIDSWIGHVNGDPFASITEAWERQHLPEPVDRFEMLEWVTAICTLGLSPVRPWVRVVRRHGSASPSEDGWESLDRPAAFTVMAIQLWNHMLTRARYLRCENEHCQVWFVQQVGRSRSKGLSHKDARYCSHKCAKAQYQRNRRRAARGEGGHA
jgi:hypothetical protein